MSKQISMNKQLALILQRAGALSTGALIDAQNDAEQNKRSLRQVILQNSHLTEEELAGVFSKHLGLPYMRLAAASIDPDAVRLVAEAKARECLCIPVIKEEAPTSSNGIAKRPSLVLAMCDPTDFIAVQEIEFATGCIVKTVVATESEIKDAINSHYTPDDWLQKFLKDVEDPGDLLVVAGEDDSSDGPPGAAEDKQAPAVKMANLIIQNAIRLGASDIHIEAAVNQVQIRNRVQGLLREYMQLPKWIQEPLVSRIKILAKMDITERRVPQDGRIRIVFERRSVDLRVSTLPTHFGEKVVMRVLGAGQSIPSTASLGFSHRDHESVKNASEQPQGIILVTGPTGSGKTTTLYSILNEKKRPDINIITVEDPIEFQLSGINQVQVSTKAGMTFAAALRSILRQDPDVILLGEIRDLETAEIAFHAAMTGHLVLSTLHTNSTAATIGRLLDLGIEPPMIVSAVNLVIAQRLLRKLCEQCKTVQIPTQKNLERLQLEHEEIEFYAPVGCAACGQTGYTGRIGVYELMRLTPAMKRLIASKAPEPVLEKAAMRAGTIPLLQGACDLVRDGVTSVDEVLRVIQLQDEEVVRCPNCETQIDCEFLCCPYCMHSLKVVCESCQQELKANWRICPYCSTILGNKSKTAAAGVPALPSAQVPMLPAAELVLSPAPENVAESVAENIAEAFAQAAGQSAASLASAASHMSALDAGCADVAPQLPSGDVRPPRILVVDDDPGMRMVIVGALHMLSSKPEVGEAEDGEAALAAISSHPPDLILLDVMMPFMNGFEVCRRLRSDIATAFVPVMMLTANTDEETRSKGFMVGTDDFMAKPVSIPELHSRVNRLLRRTYGL